MFIFDRIYGKLSFPPLIQQVLRCPGLLRLREVRMANIPFLSFPGFAATTRYEHSLGVCHLAGIFAENVGLSEKDKIEVMLAALYHDVATPPFAHAVEEFLENIYGFDHEEKLRQLIIGQTDDIGGQRAQLFLGRSLKLHSICQTKEARKIGIDIFRVADLSSGSSEDPLGDIICSDDIDLDNTDNIFRAASAMGICPATKEMPENLAKSFVFDGSKVCIDEGGIPYVKKWQRVRELLYGMIYSSIDDFAQQTMLKHALQYLSQSANDYMLLSTDWCLTDDELIHQRLLKESVSANIVKRMRLGDVYKNLSLFSVQGQNSLKKITENLKEIENIALCCFKRGIGEENLKEKKYSSINSHSKLTEIVANVYPDKRRRPIIRPFVFMGNKRYIEEESRNSAITILGVFTPYHKKWKKEVQQVFIKKLQAFFNDFKITEFHVNRKNPGINGEKL